MLITSSSLSPRRATADLFRELFRNVPGPVTVVTASDGGAPHATTVSSFCSLSLAPTYAFVALDLTSRLLPVVERTRQVGINLLADDQARIGLVCASKADDKLDSVEWRASAGLPEIDGSAGFLACDVDEVIEVGDHKIVAARPHSIRISERLPLIYHRAGFRRVGEPVR